VAASGQRRPDAAGQRWASDDALLVLPSLGKAISLYYIAGRRKFLSLLVLPSLGKAISVPPAVARIAEAWPTLPPHIQEAVLTLVEAGIPR